MRKIYSTFIAIIALSGTFSAQVNTVITAPAVNSANGTSSNRGPNGTTGHTTMRAVYHVPSSELTTLSPTVSSFGFVLTNGVNTAASGSLTVYLMNTAASSYTFGTSWSTATVGMTQAYTGTYNIPAGSTATVVDFPFPSNFTYTPGSSLLVAYDYIGSAFSSSFAVYTCYTNSVTIPVAGVTGNSNTSTSPTTLGNTSFRPLFRFGTPNTYTNEVSISNLVAAGKTSTLGGTSQTISVNVMNGSNTTLTNVAVGLAITGSNPFTDSQIIPSLTAGQSTVLPFAVYTPTANGISNMTVSVNSDQNNSNNALVWTQSVTCNAWSSNPPFGTFLGNAVGFGGGTGSGIIATRMMVPNASTLTAAKFAISTNSNTTGNPIYGVLLNNTGGVIATSQTITITAGMLGTWQTFTFTPQSLTGGTNYHLGMAQTSNTVSGYFPFGTQATTVTPSVYYTFPVAGGTASQLVQNLGYMGIEAVIAGVCGPVGISENNSDLNVSFYPNPTINGKATITGLNGVNKIAVYNMLGQNVLSFTSENETTTIDLSNQAQGNYVVRIINSDNYSRTIKVVNQ